MLICKIKNLINVHNLLIFKKTIDHENIGRVICPNISFEKISFSNFFLISEINRDLSIKAVKDMLQKNDIGVIAYLNGTAVGYGWCKHASSTNDYFMKNFNGKEGYLCRFYVLESYRGQGIYGMLISYLMNSLYTQYHIKNFTIATDDWNISSKRGIEKNCFKLICKKRFIRIFKITINKYDISA